jgi:transcriptional antiterminator Rof (Rho-off)
MNGIFVIERFFVNCIEDYDNLKLACKPIFQKINKLYEKGSSAVEGETF